MAQRFDVTAPGDIRFGAGRVAEVAEAVSGLGVGRAFLVTGRTAHRAAGLRASLDAAGIETVTFPVAAEPSVALVREAVAALRGAGCDGVVGFGGGSALDVAKAVAILARPGTDPLDHLEVVGRGLPITEPGLPCVAVPTTAGTGSEVTRNAVLAADGVKASLRSPLMLPRVAVVDPDLLAGQPAATVAAAGMDALARDGMRRSARSLRRAVELGLDDAGPDGAALREDLALASLFGGLCLANAGLGAVHGIAGVIGGRFEAPHGAVCAALLAPALDVTLRALVARAPADPAAPRAAEVAALLTGVPEADAADGVTWLGELREALAVPGLAAWGMTDADVPAVVVGARRASSTRAHPIELTEAELAEIVARAR